ncbi:MAG: efflux RND transporter periplasmic adaptor subunit [Salinivenus sp.]
MASKRSTTRRVLYGLGGLLALFALVGGAGWGLGWIGGDEQGIRVEAETAQARSITQTVTAFGRAQPEVEVAISPDVSGEIVELPVQEGDAVQEGDLLARLRPDDYRAQLDQNRAQVAQQQANLARRRADSVQARKAFERQEALFEKGVIPESEYEDAQSAYQQAEAQLTAARYQVESARATLRDSEEQLEKTRLYAPMNGTVSRLSVEVGERVVGTRERAGTEMMRIARLDRMELEVDVNEGDVVNVSDRDTAAIAFDSYPDESFRGRVTEVANSARVENEGGQNEVTNFPVTIRVLDDPNLEAARGTDGGVTRPEVPRDEGAGPVLRPGMSGSVDIYTETTDEAVAVPIQAVTVRDFNEVRPASDSTDRAADPDEEDLRQVVFVAEADTARMVEVTPGIADDSHIEVRAGLDGGEDVITGPYSAVSRELEPGSEIRIEGDGGEGMAATQ